MENKYFQWEWICLIVFWLGLKFDRYGNILFYFLYQIVWNKKRFIEDNKKINMIFIDFYETILEFLAKKLTFENFKNNQEISNYNCN